MKTFKKLYILLFFAVLSLQAQQTPAPVQKGDITLTGGVAHIGNGEVIENSLIFITDGKIVGVYDATTTKRPLKGADNKWVAFFHPKDAHGVLVEICQEIS